MFFSLLFCSCRTFGTSLSLRARQKLRLAQSFETFAQAKVRSKEEREKIRLKLKRPHDHTGSLEKYVWKSGECLAEVNCYADQHKINFTELARKFGLKNSKNETHRNAGQIVKKFLEEKGCNLDRFKSVWDDPINDSGRIRRKKKK